VQLYSAGGLKFVLGHLAKTPRGGRRVTGLATGIWNLSFAAKTAIKQSPNEEISDEAKTLSAIAWRFQAARKPACRPLPSFSNDSEVYIFMDFDAEFSANNSEISSEK
jgi:hypothetical protein